MSMNFIALLELVASAFLGDFDLEFRRVDIAAGGLSWLFLLLGRDDIDNLDAEEQRRVGGDGWAHGSVAVGVVRWADKVGFSALGESDETFIPTLDDRSLSNIEGQRLSTIVTRIKLGAVNESTSVVGFDLVSLLKLVAFAFLGDRDRELAGVDLGLLSLFSNFLHGLFNLLWSSCS